MADNHDLVRFIVAQQGVYEVALGEIRRGAKRSHWMWFVFPQVAGLGRSSVARHFAITSIAEAKAYLDHPLLGTRLRECVSALADLSDTDVRDVFGTIDAMKLKSSLTLFDAVGGGPSFTAAIDRWFGGERDELTLRILRE